MKSRKHWKLLAAAVLALSATDVTAQDQGRSHGSRMGFDSPNDPTYLLASESVQKELLLTDSQKASLNKIRDEANDKHPFLGGLIGRSQEDIQKQLDQYAVQNRSRISKILTPQQTERLNEINIQVAGVTALRFAEVAEALVLTDEQKTKLRNLADEAQHKLAELNAPNNGRPVEVSKRPEYKQKLNQITADRRNQSLALLTDEQQVKFQKLQGERFDTSKIQLNRRSFSSRGRIEAPGRVPNSTKEKAKSDTNKSVTPL